MAKIKNISNKAVAIAGYPRIEAGDTYECTDIQAVILCHNPNLELVDKEEGFKAIEEPIEEVLEEEAPKKKKKKKKD